MRCERCCRACATDAAAAAQSPLREPARAVCTVAQTGVAPAMEEMVEQPFDAGSRFDDVWRHIWDQVRPLRRHTDVVLHTGGQIDALSVLQDDELDDLCRRERRTDKGGTRVVRLCVTCLVLRRHAVVACVVATVARRPERAPARHPAVVEHGPWRGPRS